MKRVLWLVVLLLAVAAPCLAQSETAMITGRVTDQTGAVIVGAGVAVTNQATGVERKTVTNEAGWYVVPALGASCRTHDGMSHPNSQGCRSSGSRLRMPRRRVLSGAALPRTYRS